MMRGPGDVQVLFSDFYGFSSLLSEIFPSVLRECVRTSSLYVYCGLAGLYGKPCSCVARFQGQGDFGEITLYEGGDKDGWLGVSH